MRGDIKEHTFNNDKLNIKYNNHNSNLNSFELNRMTNLLNGHDFNLNYYKIDDENKFFIQHIIYYLKKINFTLVKLNNRLFVRS